MGNFQQFIHRGSIPSNPGWTRSYTCNEPSLLEPAKTSNRLTSSSVSGNPPLNEPYTYDLHGNMTSMRQLQAMQWSFKDQLYMTRRQAVNMSDQDGTQHQGERTYYVYDAAGQRIRKVTESSAGARRKERLYMGAFELYREYDAGGNVTLARETLHLMDHKKRVALVDTKTADSNAAPGSLPSTTMRYQYDNHLGTACLELDDNAALISYEEYYPYGSTSYQAGRTTAEVSLKRYRYTGKERDEETGFYYHGARYYAPWLAVWTSADHSPVLSHGLNLYAYVACNPIKYVDPSGNDNELPAERARQLSALVPVILRATEQHLSLAAAYYLVAQAYGEQGPGAALPGKSGRYRLFNEQPPVEHNPDGSIEMDHGKQTVARSAQEIQGLENRGIHIEGIKQQEEKPGQPGKVTVNSPTFTYDNPQTSVEHHIELLKSTWKIDPEKLTFQEYAGRLFSSGYGTEGKSTKDRSDDYDTKLIKLEKTK